MWLRRSPIFLAIGLVLIVVGVFLCLTFYFFMYGFASLLFGSVLVLATNRRWPFKIIAVGIPLVFVSYSWTRSFTTPETYLIPSTYRGRVLVVFNQPDGQKPEVERGRRIYRIPSSGVLFTQFAAEQGFIDQQYYFSTPAGQRKRLGVLDTRDFNEEWTTVKHVSEPPQDSVAVFNPGTMGSMGDGNGPHRKVFLELSVGTYNDLKHFKDVTTDHLDSLQQAFQKSR
jgi:membrane protein implicated in regulation of membrane protease activity